MTNNTYKVLTQEEWMLALEAGSVITELDTKDGFVHLSTSAQLAASLAFHFKTHQQVVLLQVDLAKVEDQVLHEAPTSSSNQRGGLFPHIYGSLKTEHISQTWHLERGAFILPKEVLLQAEQ